MPFSVSPGVNVSELDQTTVVPAVSTSIAAIAGCFQWGPALEPVLISSETNLVSRFGKPSSYNAETFFSAANFLAYSNSLYVCRAVDANTFNAVASNTTFTSIQVNNRDDYDAATFSTGSLYLAKYPGLIGNSLRVSVCDSANAYASTVGSPTNANNTVAFAFPVGAKSATLTVTNTGDADTNAAATTEATSILASISVGDRLLIGNTTVGQQYVQVLSKSNPVVVANGEATATLVLSGRINTLANVSQTTVQRKWEFSSLIKAAPGTSAFVEAKGGTSDEIHVVVVDEDGLFTGTKGQVLEVFQGLSRATDAMAPTGGSNYYKNVINGSSQYLWWAGDNANAVSNTAALVAASTNQAPISLSLSGGTDSADEANIAPSSVMTAYGKFAEADKIDISLLIGGKSIGGTSGELLPNYLINNIAEVRKDCVAFVSPNLGAVVANAGNELADVIAFRNLLTESSYAAMDSGYKYQYDKYNDVYRWVPLNGDVAGLCAQTDKTNDPWWSPAGFNRGNVKNVTKLAYSPGQTDRDALYPLGINPVTTFPGQGSVLYGDKTLQSKPSAFDRLNVRRLFIVLEKAIATASKFMLFEFNDNFTRAAFVNMVEPFLTQVEGRRGVYDFKVICDTTNNTPAVIDGNQFVGDIYIKPTRVAEFIQLNFTAVSTGVNFSEIAGGQG